MLTEKTAYGKPVRVKREIEDMVRRVARSEGFLDYTVRNTALLYGLLLLAFGAPIPRTDEAFILLFERVKRVVEGVYGDGEEEGH